VITPHAPPKNARLTLGTSLPPAAGLVWLFGLAVLSIAVLGKKRDEEPRGSQSLLFSGPPPWTKRKQFSKEDLLPGG